MSDVDLIRRAARVHRARADYAPEPELARSLARWLDQHADRCEGAPACDMVAIAQAILDTTCARPLPASSIGSVCGRLDEHDGRCGAAIAAMPGLPVRVVW